MFRQSLFTYVVRAMVLLTAIPIHECAHAWASWKQGDPTAKNMGRLTLNPLPHLDLIGSVLMLFTGFGWAKPVPVSTRYYKNVKKGMILTALAGPAANHSAGAAFHDFVQAVVLHHLPCHHHQLYHRLRHCTDLLYHVPA